MTLLQWRVGSRAVESVDPHVQIWPHGVPVLHPARARDALRHVPMQNIKSVLRSYKGFTGEDVVQCLAKQKGLSILVNHLAAVLEFLENTQVIKPVGNAGRLKSASNRVFRHCEVADWDGDLAVIAVHVEAAKGLLAENVSGTSNPSVVVHCGSASVSTSVVQRDLEPRWDESFLFLVRFASRAQGQQLLECAQQNSTQKKKGSSMQSTPKQTFSLLGNAEGSDAQLGLELEELQVTFKVYAHRKGKSKIALSSTIRITASAAPSLHNHVVLHALPSASIMLHLSRKSSRDQPSLPPLLALRAAFHKRGNKRRKGGFGRMDDGDEDEDDMEINVTNGSKRNLEALAMFSDCDDESVNCDESSERQKIEFKDGRYVGSNVANVGDRPLAKGNKMGCLWVHVAQLIIHDRDSADMSANLSASESCMEFFRARLESEARDVFDTSAIGVQAARNGRPRLLSSPYMDISVPVDEAGDRVSAELSSLPPSDKSLSSKVLASRPGMMTRILSSRLKDKISSSSDSGNVNIALPQQDPALGLSREVLYREQRAKLTPQIIAERRTEISEALNQYAIQIKNRTPPRGNSPIGSDSSSWQSLFFSKNLDLLASPPPYAAGVADDDDQEDPLGTTKESLDEVRCFLFDNPAKAFRLLAKESSDHTKISRASWVLLAPSFPQLCNFFNAHTLFNALLMGQVGDESMRMDVMSGRMRSLRYPVFEAYVQALQLEAASLADARRRTLGDFPGLRRFVDSSQGGKETILRVIDNVRGGRKEGRRGLAGRMSQFGGKLVITTHAIYFGKKHHFSENEMVRDDLLNATQVLESNGSADYGFMVGFKGKTHVSISVTKNKDTEKVSSNLSSPSIGAAGGAEYSGSARLAFPSSAAVSTQAIGNEYPGDSEDPIEEEDFEEIVDPDDPSVALSNKVNQLFHSMVNEGGADLSDMEDDDLGDFVDGLSRSQSDISRQGLNETSSKEESGSASLPASSGAKNRRSLSKSKKAIPTAMMTVAYPHFSISRYLVFRFPSHNSRRRRDIDILLLRNIVAFGIFRDHVLKVVLRDEVEQVRVGNQKLFEEQCISAARAEFVQDVMSFLAVVRINHTALVHQAKGMMDGIDTFEAFGDQWNVQKWMPMSLLNLVLAAVQAVGTNVGINRRMIKKASIVVLVHFARHVVCETAVNQKFELEWRQDSQGIMVAEFHRFKRNNGLQLSKISTSSSRPSSVSDPIDRELAQHIVEDRSAAPNSGTGTSSIRNNTSNTSNTNDDDNGHGISTRSMCRELYLGALDTFWIEASLQMQSNAVLSATKLKSMGQNIALLKSILEPTTGILRDTKSVVESVMNWESPRITFGLALSSLLILLAGYSSYFTGTVLGILALYLKELKSIRSKTGFTKLYIPVKGKKTLLQKYRDLKFKYTTARKILQELNMFLLKCRAVLTWENEHVTFQLLMFLATLALIVLVAPRVFYELALWVYFFTKRFRSGRTSENIKAHVRGLWESVPPTPLWDLEMDKTTKVTESPVAHLNNISGDAISAFKRGSINVRLRNSQRGFSNNSILS